MCARPQDVVREEAISTLFINNQVQAMRILSMQGMKSRPTFTTSAQGQTMLSPMSLPIRAELLGGRYTPNFPAAVIDVPGASVVMFETAVQILGTRDEWSAQQVMESLCYRMNLSLGLTDLSPCKRYVCNLVSAFGLGHGIDMDKACTKFPPDRIVYKPEHFDGFEISMQEKDEGEDGVKVTCILFSTGSGVFTGGTEPRHHVQHLKKLVRLMFECAVALPPAHKAGEAQKSGAARATKRKRGKTLYVFPESFLERDPSIPAPLRLPPGIHDDQNQLSEKRGRGAAKRRRTMHVSADVMKGVMNGVPLHRRHPSKPFYTPLPGRSVIRDPQTQTVTYWYTKPKLGFCDHSQLDPQTQKPVFRSAATPPFCSACGTEAQPFQHPQHHAQSGGKANVCSHTSCSLSLREMGPGVVMPECDNCGYIDVRQEFYGKRVARQHKAELNHTKRMHEQAQIEAREKAAAEARVQAALAPAPTPAAGRPRQHQSTREEVAHLMKQFKYSKQHKNPYARLTRTMQTLKSSQAQQFAAL